jgi:hypothetical protein
VHLIGVELEELATTYALPRQEDEPILWEICASMERILQGVMKVLVHNLNQEARRLSRTNARRLNTFVRGELSQDPIAALQNKRSEHNYIMTWQRLICYWARSVEQEMPSGEFEKPSVQLDAWLDVREAAEAVIDQLAAPSSPSDTSEAGSPPAIHIDHTVLDQASLNFSCRLICHRVKERAFNSVIVSFAAALDWHPSSKTWMPIGNYTSYLSHLIYNCQMLILLL